MAINLLARSVCFVCCSEQSFLLGGWSPSCEPFYECPSSPGSISCISPSWGLAFLAEVLLDGEIQIHPSMHPTLHLSQFFSPGTAQPLLQTLSRGLLPPSLISAQPSATVNKQNVKFLVGLLLANRVQPSRHASLLQTPKIIFSLEENMTQCSVYTLYICKSAAPF